MPLLDSRNSPRVALLAVGLALGCTPPPTDTGDTGDTGAGETGADTSGDTGVDSDTDTSVDTDTGADTDTDATGPNLRLHVTAYLSGFAVRDADVTLGEQSQVTDRNGDADFLVASDEPYEARMNPDGYGPIRLVAKGGGEGQIRENFEVPSEDTKLLMASIFSVDLAEGTGIVAFSVGLGRPGSWVALPGVSIRTDTPADLSLAYDNSKSERWSEGYTTLEGQSSTIVFINVPAGTVTPTLTPSDNVECVVDPPSITVDAGGFTAAHYYCAYPPRPPGP